MARHDAAAGAPGEQLVMTKRGWTEHDWARWQDRLREQGLLDAAGALTPAGTELRVEVERDPRLGFKPHPVVGESTRDEPLLEQPPHPGADSERWGVRGARPSAQVRPRQCRHRLSDKRCRPSG
ncbi:helix-turn-helix domain-containing protein [Actinokineospora baliensis]|uniref:helix-turn-helix domain-containing protein n=1 Tax=Actinokineospora baliensis TaxID=547056 RepID=UPI0035571AA8